MGPARRTSFGADLGANVAARRLKLGLTQEELARRVDMTVPRLSDLERGAMKVGPGGPTLRRLATALSISLEKLLPYEDFAA